MSVKSDMNSQSTSLYTSQTNAIILAKTVQLHRLIEQLPQILWNTIYMDKIRLVSFLVSSQCAHDLQLFIIFDGANCFLLVNMKRHSLHARLFTVPSPQTEPGFVPQSGML